MENQNNKQDLIKSIIDKIPSKFFPNIDGGSSGFSLQNTSSPCILRWVPICYNIQKQVF